MKKVPAGVVAACLALLAAAQITCGGSGAPPHCDQVEPCGGDVVGAWTFAGGCENTAVANMNLSTSCPGGSINSINISVTGSIAFNSDMTYMTTNVNASIHASETVPLSCTTATSCAAVTSTATGTTVTCSGGTTCTCSVTVTGLSGGVLGGTTSGTYSISVTTLTLQTAATTSSNDYCVQGNEVHFMSVDTTTNMGPMGMATIRSDLVVVKP